MTSSTFTTADLAGWTYPVIKTCGSYGYTDWNSKPLMGMLGKGLENQKKTFTSLPPHWSISLRVDILLFGAYTGTDYVEVLIDSVSQGKVIFDSTQAYYICESAHTDYLSLYRANTTHTASTAEINIHTITTAVITIAGSLIKNLFLYVDTCDNSCLTCNGPSSSNCLTCPLYSTLSSNTCTCNSGYYQHINSCVTSCPTNFIVNSTTRWCVFNPCSASLCATCSSSLCTACTSGLYLWNGQCLSSCPIGTSQSGSTCIDLSAALQNGTTLFRGFSSNSFGESQILGSGFSIANFRGLGNAKSSGAYTTFCNTQQLVGGAFLTAVSSTSTKTFTGLPPHSSIRVGVKIMKMDSWDSQSVFIKADTVTKGTFTSTTAAGSSICGWSYNDLLYQMDSNFTHTATTFALQIATNIDQDPYDESYGWRELWVIMSMCTSNCLVCSDSTCTTCESGFVLTNKLCLCDSSCKTCSGTSTSCSSCYSPSYLNPGTGLVCLATCPVQYWARDSDRTCISCYSNCYTCTSSASTDCLTCNGSYYLYNGSCSTTCLSNYYKSTVTNNNKCLICHKTCTTCNGGLSTNCLTCTLPLYFQSVTNECNSSCNSNQYKNTSSATCSPCHATCATCSGGTATTCLSCTQGGTLYFDSTPKSCVSTCPNGTYKNTSTNVCSPCNSSCKTCDQATSSSCLSCNSPYFLETLAKQCVSTCYSNEYGNTTNQTCTLCNSTCLTCSAGLATNCLSCTGIYYYNSQVNTCVTTCPGGYYGEPTTNKCTVCNTSCLTCSGPTNRNCLSCTGSSVFYQSKCLILCPDGYYKDTANHTCTLCDSTCNTCDKGGIAGCTSCVLPLYLQPSNQTCVYFCLSNQFKNSASFPPICQNCDPSCTTCNNALSTGCLSCSSGYYYNPSTGQCVSSCPVKFYGFISTMQCYPCHSSCLTCSASAATNCLTCDLPSYFQTSTSTCGDCQSNQFKNPAVLPPVCGNCYSSCTTCNGSATTNCLSCSGVNYLNPTGTCATNCPANYFKQANVCVACEANCNGCTGPLNTNCSACKTTSFLDMVTGECLATCHDGQYGNTSTKKCANCNANCATCSGSSSSNCLSCTLPNYFQPATTTCETTCYSNQFQNPQLLPPICRNCSTNCLTCSNTNTCLTCTSPWLLSVPTSTCKPSCGAREYEESTHTQCLGCHSTCYQCIGSGINDCIGCIGNEFWSPTHSSCLTKCPDAYYGDIATNSCLSCDANCLTCSGPNKTQCLTCSSDKVFYESTCLQSCPSGYQKSQTNNTCEELKQLILAPMNQLIVYVFIAKSSIWVLSAIKGYLLDKKDITSNSPQKVAPISPLQTKGELNLKEDGLQISELQLQETDTKRNILDSSPTKTKSSLAYGGEFTPGGQPILDESGAFQRDKNESPVQTSRKKNRKGKGTGSSFMTATSFLQINSATKIEKGYNPTFGEQSNDLQSMREKSQSDSQQLTRRSSNEKLKYSLLGNEWIEYYLFYDPSISRINRSTIIFMKYQIFSYTANAFSNVAMIPACLFAGLAAKAVLSLILSQTTKLLRLGNIGSTLIFTSAVVYSAVAWFKSAVGENTSQSDSIWTNIYLITFGIDLPFNLNQVYQLQSSRTNSF